MAFKKGQSYNINLCGHTGRIVWVSDDSKTIGVKCPKTHYRDFLTNEPYPSNGFSDHVGKRDIVYLIGV